MDRKGLLLIRERAKASLLRPWSNFNNIILQQHHQFRQHFSIQSGGSTNLNQQRIFKTWFSKPFSFGKKKVDGIPYFPIVLGFAASGCLGTGLLAVFADGGHSPPNISNIEGIVIILLNYLLKFHF